MRPDYKYMGFVRALENSVIYTVLTKLEFLNLLADKYYLPHSGRTGVNIFKVFEDVVWLLSDLYKEGPAFAVKHVLKYREDPGMEEELYEQTYRVPWEDSQSMFGLIATMCSHVAHELADESKLLDLVQGRYEGSDEENRKSPSWFLRNLVVSQATDEVFQEITRAGYSLYVQNDPNKWLKINVPPSVLKNIELKRSK